MKAKLTFKKVDPWSGHKVYESCKHAITPYIKRSGVLYTGLNGIDNDLVRERLEKELGVDLKPHSSYWDEFAVFLSEKDIILDTEIPEQELKYYFLKDHKNVAFGLSDHKPSTDYILLQAEEEAKEKNVKARRRRKAISEFDKLSLEDMKKALRLYGYNSKNTNGEVIESNLYKLVEENPARFLSIWVDNKTKETEFLIEEACSKSILRKSGTVYKFGSDVVGHTLEQTVDYLDNPANADLKMSILAQIQGKDVAFGDKKADKDESTSQFAKLKKEIEAEEKTVETKKTSKKDK